MSHSQHFLKNRIGCNAASSIPILVCMSSEISNSTVRPFIYLLQTSSRKLWSMTVSGIENQLDQLLFPMLWSASTGHAKQRTMTIFNVGWFCWCHETILCHKAESQRLLLLVPATSGKIFCCQEPNRGKNTTTKNTLTCT